MTPPIQSASVQPGVLQRHNDGIIETGSQVSGSSQNSGVGVAVGGSGVLVAPGGGVLVGVAVGGFGTLCGSQFASDTLKFIDDGGPPTVDIDALFSGEVRAIV